MAKLNKVSPEQWDKTTKKHSLNTMTLEPTDSWDLDKYEEAVNSPKHYNNGEIETIDYIVDVLGKHEAMAYCQGNIIKYTGSRLWAKGNPIQDAKKAKWYLEKLIELMIQTEGETW